jgi:hypothetical protein
MYCHDKLSNRPKHFTLIKNWWESIQPTSWSISGLCRRPFIKLAAAIVRETLYRDSHAKVNSDR